MDSLMLAKEKEYIRNIGLTNFDTQHMVDLIDQGAPITSNQVSFSVIDTRPLEKMVPANIEKGVKLLCYGTLLGGYVVLLHSHAPMPTFMTRIVDLRTYHPWQFHLSHLA
jgi:diketogulonate reductase-like aldo/keto reductase